MLIFFLLTLEDKEAVLGAPEVLSHQGAVPMRPDR